MEDLFFQIGFFFQDQLSCFQSRLNDYQNGGLPPPPPDISHSRDSSPRGGDPPPAVAAAAASLAPGRQVTQEMHRLISDKLDLFGKLRELETKKMEMDKLLRDFDHLNAAGEMSSLLPILKQPPLHQQTLTHLEPHSAPQPNPPMFSSLNAPSSKLPGFQPYPSKPTAVSMYGSIDPNGFPPSPVSHIQRQPPQRSGDGGAEHQVLLEMQEQLRLQKDLHLRRKELESLMKKDWLENYRKNSEELMKQQNFSDVKSDISLRSNLTGGGWFNDAQSSRTLDSASNLPTSRSRQMSISSQRSNSYSESGTSKKLQMLQNQVEHLQLEIRRLHSEPPPPPAGCDFQPQPPQLQPTVPPPPQQQPPQTVVNFPTAAALEQNQQQSQIQQLSQSVNHCLHALLSVQRDLAQLQRTVEKLAVAQTRQAVVPPTALPPANRNNTNSGSVANDQSGQDDHPWHCQMSDLDFNHLLRTSDDSNGEWLWNELPVDNSSSVALNNQLPPPGARANNYWDNFRSFSRQNRFSSGSNVAQVTPRQQQVQQQQPTSTSHLGSHYHHHHHHHRVDPQGAQVRSNDRQHPERDQQRLAREDHRQSQQPVAASSSRQHQQQHQQQQERQPRSYAFIEPNFNSLNNSPPRPRRKQKINREQNRDEERAADPGQQNLSSTASAMVFPMPQNQQSQNNVNQAVVSPVVNTLTRSIYNQVNSLVSRHEQQPDTLARIFHDLQRFEQNSSSSQRREQTTESRHSGAAVPTQEVTFPAAPASASLLPAKLRTDKRFVVATPNMSSPSNPGRCEASRGQLASDEETPFLFGGRRGESVRPSSSSQASIAGNINNNNNNNNVAAAAAAAAAAVNVGGVSSTSDMAVPKNVQRKWIASEQRNSKQRGSENGKLRNMLQKQQQPDQPQKRKQQQQQQPATDDHEEDEADVEEEDDDDDFNASPPANETSRMERGQQQQQQQDDFVTVQLRFRNPDQQLRDPVVIPPLENGVGLLAAAMAGNDIDGQSEMAEADQVQVEAEESGANLNSSSNGSLRADDAPGQDAAEHDNAGSGDAEAVAAVAAVAVVGGVAPLPPGLEDQRAREERENMLNIVNQFLELNNSAGSSDSELVQEDGAAASFAVLKPQKRGGDRE